MIELKNVNCSYGNLQVLWDIQFKVTERDSVVALVGPNGAGKSTLLNTIAGIHAMDSGEIEIFGQNIENLSPHDIVKLGFGYVTEERNLFGEMSVKDNLEMGAYTSREKTDELKQDVFELFPVLDDRQTQLAKTLSGGEQQMLAIGRGLMADPKIIALDEPTTGLAPQLVDDLFDTLDEISSEVQIILVEQLVNRTLEFADRAYLLEDGRIRTQGDATEMLDSDHVHEAYLK